ncbi:hypothetical protein FIBSPDRAFT_68240 [Athelia psychrophila]|uniref:Uncharacterized protein n=1 Tax=Athelia psychrophila TaxID=1759441 RepID=A0A166EQ78_9AGAM|nr:hypothetical protein FIBSPDRAFT_68240 [Fibularhizoctonia sp. CBS 109695]
MNCMNCVEVAPLHFQARLGPPSPQSHGPPVHFAAPALCCPTHDLAALSLAFVSRAAAACPHLLAVIALSARATPAFLPLLHPPGPKCQANRHQHHPGARLPYRLRGHTSAPLTALGIHRTTSPRAQTLHRLVASFPALERLALSETSVVPCMYNAYEPALPVLFWRIPVVMIWK